MPDLPKASYRVWVRGYGLVDSPKVQATPGKSLALRAVKASSPAEAALLSSRTLAGVDGDAGQERVPGHWRQRQRDLAEHEEPGD